MSDTSNESAAGRGRRKRREAAARREHRENLAWWTKPGVLVFLGALLLAALGAGLVLRSVRGIPVQEATLGGLHMRVGETRWLLDQMDHGENFEKPSVMMPDMPEWGNQRVSLDLALRNESPEQQIFEGSEFVLVPEVGDEVPPVGAQVGRAPLEPGQNLNTVLYFDMDTTEPHGRLRVAWRRDGKSVYLPIPEPAEHYHLRPRGGEVALPADARLLLPIGKADRGENLYNYVYGCVACHGDPGVPDTNNVGPHLAGIGTAGGERVEGQPAPQYIYESILYPGDVIAPECKGGKPCAEPSAMPEYASLVSLQDVADLLTYLLEQ